MPKRTERVIRNRNYRYPVTVVEERPDLAALGLAGARLALELMLSAPEGVPSHKLRRLKPAENAALRKVASADDPAYGIMLQKAALGALGQVGDEGAALMMARLAQRPDVDLRVKSEAIAALGEVGGDGARDVLRDVIETGQPETKAQAALALTKLGTVADVGLLEAVAEADESFVGEIARSAALTLREKLHLEG